MIKKLLERPSLALVVPVTILITSAIAESNGNLADVPFKATHMFLTGEGYRSIMMINGNQTRNRSMFAGKRERVTIDGGMAMAPN